MAHRLISHHRAFFSPRHLAGVSQYISTTTARNYEVKDYFEFKDKVLKSEKPVLVDFHATWCGPCKQLAPMLDSVVDMKDGAVELAKVDIDNNAELAMEYGCPGFLQVFGLFSHLGTAITRTPLEKSRSLIGKSKKNVLEGAHKKFERCRHTEMYLVALKAQDEGKIELPPDRVTAVPTVLGVRDGKVVDRLVGLVNNEQLSDLVAKITNGD